MRKSDRELLAKAYVKELADDVNAKFAYALGIVMPKLQDLRKLISADLDEKTFGIGWWSVYPDLDHQRRILISDQLIQSLASIQDQIVEVKIHTLELFAAWDAEAKKMKSSMNADTMTVDIPESIRPADDLDRALVGLHLKGFFNGMCSALDCLAAGVIGVMALRVDLKTAGHPGLKRHLADRPTYATLFQQSLFHELALIEGRSGPNGWLDWMFDFRNMSAHRGRRLNFTWLELQDTGLLKRDMYPLYSTNVVHCLVKNPAVSELESFKDQALEPLSEPGELTINELFLSVVYYIEQVSEMLAVQWQERRADPRLAPQPLEQWKEIRNGSFRAFDGYSPGTIVLKADQAIASPERVRRLKCAAMDKKDFSIWKTEK